jgi:hypothetical protein
MADEPDIWSEAEAVGGPELRLKMLARALRARYGVAGMNDGWRDAGAVTAGQVYRRLTESLRRKPTLTPRGADAAAEALVEAIGLASDRPRFAPVALDAPLAEVFPWGKRRIVAWAKTGFFLETKLPDLEPNESVITVIGGIAAVSAIGIMVVVAQWLDANHPVDDPGFAARGAGKALGWVVFIVLMLLLMYLPIRLIGIRFMRFPKGMTTVADLVRVVAPPYASAAARAHQDTPEQLWGGVRQAVALANGVSPDQVTQHTRLDERRG